jgi:hypothetical protein
MSQWEIKASIQAQLVPISNVQMVIELNIAKEKSQFFDL